MPADSATEEILQDCSPEMRQLAEGLRKLVKQAFKLGGEKRKG